jgi:hypothetical protein
MILEHPFLNTRKKILVKEVSNNIKFEAMVI